MIVIADTGPINYLILIDAIDVLPKLYGRILVPPSVSDELRHPRAPEAVRKWILEPPQWFEVRPTTRMPDNGLLAADLEIGERDAILLAEEIEADELIIDDGRGRQEAARRRMHFVGTLGVLRTAANVGLVDFKMAVNRLRATNFHIARSILDQLIKEDE